jgi:outer membrane murein-binding lipoprotein Lpp
MMKSGGGCLKRPVRGWRGLWSSALVVLFILSACSPAAKTDEARRREIQDLKAEVAVLKEKLAQLQTGQQAILDLLKQGKAAVGLSPGVTKPGEPGEVLTVSQLLTEKDRYLGTRVTVQGPVGPVLVHRKAITLKSPEGMVEVLLGNLPDEKLVQRLTSIPINHPLKVTGLLGVPTRGGAKLQIIAEAVEF